MPRRRFHNGEDPAIREYYDNFRRAEATLWASAKMVVGWGLALLLGVVIPAGLRPVADTAATFFGWAALAFLAVWALQFLYAYLYPRVMFRKDP